ncbi:AraC family transcriptional regulator [Rathayibacter tanaceti]|uniref:HTH-type transcriptional activator RhaS n=2 Tax=Rathayibacter tanaceti TaxID=1671680 RepID=A0A162F8C2_9MICO|nr:helix-turn-helix domain-containing protein [Rathayibacter tanaceti]KZX20403.1 HTH-type transcriptional activator RhaS [Rathayibacter tanaceti]QHC54409.1 helix-turn-helix domain-containing protein [Rathayibacter tanaceti]TCO35115.1 helix-turn-helix protein [Rathayibacter tanaceti]
MDDDHPQVRLATGGGDPDEARHRLARLYNGDEWQAATTASEFTYRYAAIGDAGMTLRTSRMSGRLAGVVGDSDDVVVQWIVGGSARLDLGRSSLTMEANRPVLFPVGRSFAFDYVDFDQRLVHLDRGVVDRVAAECGLLGLLAFDSEHRPEERALRRWRAAVAASARALRSERVEPLLWDELTRRTVSALLELYPPEAAPAPPELLAPRNARMRIAVEYVHAHCAEPIGPAEIAEAAGLTVRGLQSAFQRVLGVRPIAYLRSVRLDRARVELTVASPHDATVASIARRWGFGNPGRFSAAYAERFGESPSATLQR